MSTLEKEKLEILSNLPAPDAVLPPSPQTEQKRGRGRPPKSGNVIVKKDGSTKQPVSEADVKEGAVAINTAVFTVACVLTGTGKVFPEKERADVMDKALARYMSMKGINVPPEVALVAAYSAWIKEISTDQTVKESVAKRYGGKLGKFASFFSRFKKKEKTQ